MSEQAAKVCPYHAGALLLPCAPLVGAAVFGIVVELGEALLEARADGTIFQIRHGHFVLLLYKRLRTTRTHKAGQFRQVLQETTLCFPAVPWFLHCPDPRARRTDHRPQFRDIHPPVAEINKLNRKNTNKHNNNQCLALKLDFLD